MSSLYGVLDVLLFACAYMMLTSIAPDHFGISFFLLVCFLYLCAMSIRGRWHMPAWVSAAFAVVVTGVTVTNGVKVVLGHLFCVGRRRLMAASSTDASLLVSADQSASRASTG